MDLVGSETQPPDVPVDVDTDHNTPPLAPACKSYKWKIQVIDDDGRIEGIMVSCKDVWKFTNTRAIVHFDEDTGQPIGDAGGLLGSFIGQVSNDLNLLPINYTDWRKVNPHHKNRAWDVIQSKFWFDDAGMRKGYVMSALGSRCKDVKLRLWREYKRDTLAETLQNQPENVPVAQWEHLVDMRFQEKWKKMQERNTKNQKKHTMPHVCGRKSFSRKRNEIKTKTGKDMCRGEFFIESRTKSDGNFVCEEARTRAEKLTEMMSTDPLGTNNIASLDDEYVQVFGPEPAGRVRCVGRGPTPSKLVRRRLGNGPESENSQMVVDLKSKVNDLTKQVTSLTAFVQQVMSSSTPDQALALATALVNIPNSTPTNLSSQSNTSQEVAESGNGISNIGRNSA